MKKSLLLLLLLCSCAALDNSAIVLKGRILGWDKKPIEYAEIALKGEGINEKCIIEDDGMFEFAVENTGGYYAIIIAPFHESVFFPLMLEKEGAVSMNITLKAADFSSFPDTIYITDEYEKYPDRHKEIMLKNSDGTYSLKVATPADTFAYMLSGIFGEDYTNEGTQTKKYKKIKGAVHEGGTGNFACIIDTPEDSTVVIFNPKKVPGYQGNLEIGFDADNAYKGTIININRELKKRSAKFWDKYKEYTDNGGDPKKFDLARDDDVAYILDEYKKTDCREIKDYALLNYFAVAITDIDSVLVDKCYQEVSPSSIAWSLMWGNTANIFYRIARKDKDQNRPGIYAERVVNENRDKNVASEFLMYLLDRAKVDKNDKKVKEYYERMLSEFGETYNAKRAKTMYSPQKQIVKGKIVPQFVLVSLLDSTQRITDKSIRGDYVLIDFWATWCGPCKGEMENLHKAYEKYQDKNFTILSISFDKRSDDAVQYIKNEWPMPWMHAWIKEGFQSKIAEKFEITGIPKPILIDAKGVIMATDGELRGENLEKTLSSIIIN